MRALVRSAAVGAAAVGLAFAGVASAQACGQHDSSDGSTITKTSIEDSFNDYDFFSHNFNNTVVFGDQTL